MATDTEDLPNRIRTGEYFRVARRLYHTLYVEPIGERYVYLVITLAALIVCVAMGLAVSLLFPLNPAVPLVITTDNIADDVPRITPLATDQKENVNSALQRYLAQEYVLRRESYDFRTLDANVRFVRAQSSDAVYQAWQQTLDPNRPESPLSQFQRHSVRQITIRSATPAGQGRMEVRFRAEVVGQTKLSPASFLATVAFQFADVSIDQTTGKTTPVQFSVTDYQVQRLQE